MSRPRLYKLPRTSSRSPSRSLSRLATERRNLQGLASQWEDEVLSTHIGRAMGNLQQQRKLEKLFGQMLQQALKLNNMRIEDVVSRNPGSLTESLLPRMDSLLERSLSSALAPKPRTKITTQESERSQAELSRFRAAASDVQRTVQSGQARNLRNQ